MFELIKGKTESGFKYEINKDVANDYELVEMLGEYEENPFILSKIVNKVLGQEQNVKLKEHCRNDSGVVQTDKMMKEIMGIFNSASETKNS